jgi:hypothetical protein
VVGRFVVLALLLAPLLAPKALLASDVWLEVERPHNGWVELGVSPLLIVGGEAGSVGQGHLDLVVLVDMSRSTAHSSGVDVNDDGHLGGIGWSYRRDWRSYVSDPSASSDPADSIFNASIEALRRLVARLDRAKTRVAVVTFRDHATVRSDIENTRGELTQNLDAVSVERPSGRTDMGLAIRTALRAFERGSGSAPPVVERAVVLLSDGRPTVPDPPERAEQRAIDAAVEAHEAAVRIYTIGLAISEEESRVLLEIARMTGGAHAALDRPGDILEVLPQLDLRGLADVKVVNTTTRERARAVRVWGDESFDGYVRLRPGKNRLLITASTPSGGIAREVRWVYFEEREPLTARDRRVENRRLREMRDLLRTRSVRVEVEREMEAARVRREAARQVEISVE